VTFSDVPQIAQLVGVNPSKRLFVAVRDGDEPMRMFAATVFEFSFNDVPGHAVLLRQ
jgi:hypothetical protein